MTGEGAREQGSVKWEGEMASNSLSRNEEEKGGSPSAQHSPGPISSGRANEMGANYPTTPKIAAAVLESPAISEPRKSSSTLKPE